MKAYAGAGLTKLGEISQHRSETLTSLIQCTNFRRTHNFLVQTMEAFYCFFLTLYTSASTNSSGTKTMEDIQGILTTLVTKFNSVCGVDELDTLRGEIQRGISSTGLCFDEFQKCMGGADTKAGHRPLLVQVCINRYDGLFWALCCYSLSQLGSLKQQHKITSPSFLCF